MLLNTTKLIRQKRMIFRKKIKHEGPPVNLCLWVVRGSYENLQIKLPLAKQKSQFIPKINTKCY